MCRLQAPETRKDKSFAVVQVRISEHGDEDENHIEKFENSKETKITGKNGVTHKSYKNYQGKRSENIVIEGSIK